MESYEMIALKRILVPCDFSYTSAAAVRYAVALARNFGARLHILHVGDRAQSQFESEFPIGLENAVEDAVRERLLRIVTPQEQMELNPEFAVRAGSRRSCATPRTRISTSSSWAHMAADWLGTWSWAVSPRKWFARRRARCLRYERLARDGSRLK